MENNEVNVHSVELQKHIQKLEKLEKMINPNSKKSLILWEEDDAFKKLIADLKDYALTCSTEEFPVELLDKLKALQTDAVKQIVDGTTRIVDLKEQAKTNLELSRTLSAMYISAMAAITKRRASSNERVSNSNFYLCSRIRGVCKSRKNN